MVSAETSAGTTRYYYDPLGRRIAKLRTDKNWQWFGWDGDQIAFETTGEAAVHYVYDPQSFAPLAQVTTEAIGSTPLPQDYWPGADLPEQHPRPFGAIHYHHTDHLGTPRELTDGVGKIALTMNYKAWGEGEATQVEGADANLINPFRFRASIMTRKRDCITTAIAITIRRWGGSHRQTPSGLWAGLTCLPMRLIQQGGSIRGG